MKSLKTPLLILSILLATDVCAQDAQIKGYRVKASHVITIYLNNPVLNQIRLDRTRVLNSEPYFLFITDHRKHTTSDKIYSLIIFPGVPFDFSGLPVWDHLSRNMNLISNKDYGRTFWIDDEAKNNIEPIFNSTPSK